MKYVRHETKGFFIFPESSDVIHAEVGCMLGLEGLLSAGFIMFYCGAPTCYGRSESLNLGVRDDDTDALRKQLGFEAWEFFQQESG